MQLEQIALIGKALGDSNRLQIIQWLTEGELCACEILERLHITQPTLSYHMKHLVGVDLVIVRKEGKWNHYSLNCNTLTMFRDYIAGLRCHRARNEEGCGCK